MSERGTLAAITAINDALQVAAAITHAMRVAQLAGREVTLEEVEAAKNSLIASEQELQDAVDTVRKENAG